MSSLVIAEIIGKQHAHVMRDIREVLNQAGIGESKFGGTYQDARYRDKPCYHLPRRECDLLISGYSVPYRLAIIDRWHELEAKEAVLSAALTVPQPLGEALRLAAGLADRNEQQARLLGTTRPAVEFVEKLADDTGLQSVQETTKSLVGD